MSFTRLAAIVCLATGIAASTARADDPAAPPPRKLLFIGNSYLQAARPAIDAMFGAGGYDPATAFVYITPGGATLTRHAADPAVLARIAEGGWTHVLLQEQSQTPAYPPMRAAFLDALAALEAKARAVGARTVLVTTWGYIDGDARNRHTAPDYATMQRLLGEGFAAAVERLGDKIEVAPVDRVWAAVRAADDARGRRLYGPDGSHPSGAGATLVGATLYRALQGKMPAVLRADSTSEDDAKAIFGAVQAAFERR